MISDADLSPLVKMVHDEKQFSLDVSLDDDIVVEHAEDLLAMCTKHGQGYVLVAAFPRAMHPAVELTRQLRVHREQVFLNKSNKEPFTQIKEWN